MLKTRARKLNEGTVGTGPIVYWVDRDLRAQDNWALLSAQKLAAENKVPVIVVYNLVVNFLQGSARQWDFKLKTLEKLAAELAEKNIPFFLVLDETGKDSVKLLSEFFAEHKVGAVITDFSPLKIQREWKNNIAKKVDCAFFEIDAHNIVPVWLASPKQEFGAYTLRPKLHRLLPEYLDDFPSLPKHPVKFGGKVPSIDWKKLLNHSDINQDAKPVDWVKPGADAAKKVLHEFISERLGDYGKRRNDPLANAQSNLSPYLHYGVISAQRIALEVLKHEQKTITKIVKTESSAAAFLEELIVRRELADNFCYYNHDYDNPNGFPDWAKKSLAAHASDVREYLYSKKKFEEANTHDDLWNAAQQELVKTGKMPGYLRMYWAKKIMEWTKSPAEAMDIAIYLNDKYELDGRDPNGYTGIAWSIGGLHDRAWFTRPIFGQIRYMARSGCEKKFTVKEYISKFL